METCPNGRKITKPHNEDLIDQGQDPDLQANPARRATEKILKENWCLANSLAGHKNGQFSWVFCEICAHRIGKGVTPPPLAE